MTMSRYEDIQRRHLESGTLYEDPDFKASSSSLYPGINNPEDWLWKRPKELSKKPGFIVDGASRFDLIQGELGDCWFVAAAAVLATRPNLFERVVPGGQDFGPRYAGVFRFRFWRFGEWVEVVIDDQLPVTKDGKLRFGQNRSCPGEFWGALLEKAYAKLQGSYSAIHAGHIRDALVDMTGGISEDFNLRKPDRLPPDLFSIIKKSFHLGSVMGAGIWGDAGSMTEEKMWNGLFKGHAYSITAIVQKVVAGWQVKLLRLRNPWGEGEWTGPWSDKSDEWKSLSAEDRESIGLRIEEDGEFWISYDDWLSNFHALDIVHLGPHAFARPGSDEDSVPWQETVYHGKWVRGVSAGGSGLFASNKDLYYTNPQYHFKLEDPDKDDVSDECTCVISLMQKHYRKRKLNPAKKSVIIGFDVHQVKTSVRERLEPDTYFDRAKLKKQFQTRTPLREVSCRLVLDPGTYCVIPNTFKANEEAEFLLRIYTYSKIASGHLHDETSTDFNPDVSNVEKPMGLVSNELFMDCAGPDGVVDARDLRDLLSQLAKSDMGETMAFSSEACRSLIAMVDTEQSGVLDFDDVIRLWDELLMWKKIFHRYDRDKSGCIETYELRRIFKDIGLTLHEDTISTFAVRYGGKERTLFFEDFAICLSRVMTLYASFKHHSAESPGQATLNLDQWLQTLMYM